jgi:prepilin-type N-terminal cleavage/methylation domain-containing protein
MRKIRAFTLVELLVVVAIIGLLIAILLPSLGRARDQAKTMKCTANMREVGQIIYLFAADHDNRGPGGASDVKGNSIAWQQILNAEVLERSKNSKYGVTGRFGAVSDTRTLSCTNYTPGGKTDYSRPWVLNGGLTGSTGGGTPNNPGENDWYYAQSGIGTPLSTYHLGAKMSRFHPDQFMLYESHAGNDLGTNVTTPDAQGRIVAPLDGFPSYMVNYKTYPGYNRDSIAFRHPFFQGANFLHFDGSAVTLKPSDDVADGPKRASHMKMN